METILETAIRKAKQARYRLSRSLDRRQIEDLEELLAKEEKKRKELQEERPRMGEEVRELVRKETERVIGNYERRKETERIKEWKLRESELGEEMRRVLEEWEERRRAINREKMRKELERALRKRDDRIREEMGEWVKVVDEREGGARDAGEEGFGRDLGEAGE